MAISTKSFTAWACDSSWNKVKQVGVLPLSIFTNTGDSNAPIGRSNANYSYISEIYGELVNYCPDLASGSCGPYAFTPNNTLYSTLLEMVPVPQILDYSDLSGYYLMLENDTGASLRTGFAVSGTGGGYLRCFDENGTFVIDAPIQFSFSRANAPAASFISTAPTLDYVGSAICIRITVYSSGIGVQQFSNPYFTNIFWAFWNGLSDYISNPDPYNPGGGQPGWNPSSPDPIGGGGTFDNLSDPIPEPTVPTISAVDCGFVTLYNPTLVQLDALSAYMWSPLFSIDSLKKIFADPMDIILGLMIVPVDVPAGITQEVTVGGFPTGVTMTKAAEQYIEKDCGSITLAPFFGSYLDYSPYTKVQLFLPFIGTVEMNADELQGRTVNIKYIVDIATGACTAFVRLTGASGRAEKSNLSGPLYTFAGQCCQPVPVTGSNWNQLISSVVQVATTTIAAGSGAIGGAFAASQATQIGGDFTPEFAPEAVGDTGMESRHEIGSYRPVSHMRSASPEQIEESFLPPSAVEATPVGLGSVGSSELPKSKITPLGLTGAAGTVAGLVNSVMSSKPSIGHSGSLSSVSGMIGIKTPFFIITRPSLTIAETYRELHGYPANSTQNFSDLAGFTKVEACRLENMTCLTPELNEIYGWLKEGVVF